jgi:hypothetical protein
MYGGTQFHPIQGVRGIITKTAFINVTGQFACALTDECQVIAIRVDDGKVVYKPEGITADTLDAAKDAVNEALYPRSPVSFEPRHYMQDHYTSGGGGMRDHAMTMGQMSPRYDQPTYTVGRSAATGAAFNPYTETHAYSNDNGNPPFADARQAMVADPGRAAVAGMQQQQQGWSSREPWGVVHQPRDAFTLAFAGASLAMVVGIAVGALFLDTRAGFKESGNQISQLTTAVKSYGETVAGHGRRLNVAENDLHAHNTELTFLRKAFEELKISAHSHREDDRLAIDQGPTGSAAAGQTPSNGLVVYGSNKEQDAPPSGNNIEVKKVAESAGGGALAKKDTISDYIASGFSWISMIIGACMISFIVYLFVYEHLKTLAE